MTYLKTRGKIGLERVLLGRCVWIDVLELNHRPPDCPIERVNFECDEGLPAVPE